MQTPVFVHRAPWLFSMAGPVLADGAVALHGRTIAAVGSFRELKREFSGAQVVDHPDCALIPGLINTHIHLELSHLAHLGKASRAKSFTGWIAEMLAEREALGFVGPHVDAAALAVLDRQYDSGIIALADIGNTGIGQKLACKFSGFLFPFLEYLGLTKASLVAALKKLEREDDHVACTAHAPYSAHPDLIRALKWRANQLGFLFPIHVAEPDSERSMICEGRGEIVDFLQQRGFYDDAFQVAGIDIEGSVQYLHNLGILDNRTLCVHAIHVNVNEIRLLKESGAKVCLCPGSNQFLQVGKAPVSAYLQHGILPALGTDSVASNPEVSIWREMQLLSEDHPDVAPHDILRMATVGGAVALGIESECGTLTRGKIGRFLAVPVSQEAREEREVCAALVHTGSSQQPQWVTA